MAFKVSSTVVLSILVVDNLDYRGPDPTTLQRFRDETLVQSLFMLSAACLPVKSDGCYLPPGFGGMVAAAS